MKLQNRFEVQNIEDVIEKSSIFLNHHSGGSRNPVNYTTMIDLQKQIHYWIKEAEDNILSADILIQKGRLLHGLFFCHLVIEKAIKAHVAKETKKIPPRSHNLILLSEKANLKIDDSSEIFLGILMKYQLQGRYPDYDPIIPEKEKVQIYFDQTKELLQWLKEKL